MSPSFLPRVFLRQPTLEDSDELVSLAVESRSFHHPWVAPSTDLTGVHRYLQRFDGERNLGFLICLVDGGAIAGQASITEIVRGVFQSGYLAFFAHHVYAGRGLMQEGLALVLDHAFGDAGLHRLEANVQPDNRRSLALVRGLGFRHEGFSPRYLQIGGEWKDHERWAILAEEWQERRRP